MTKNATPRVYVACLASYNSGILFGEWIDVNCDADELSERVQAIIAKSPTAGAEEWAFHDYEGFAGFKMGENEPVENLVKVASLIEEYDEDVIEAAFGWLCDAEEVAKALENGAYAGTYDTPEDWAEEFLEDTGTLSQIPENLRCYFDFEKYARDCDLEGSVYFAPNGAVFHCN
jgi:antirestriction protein